MGAYKHFQRDRSKYKNGVKDIYNPEGNSYEKGEEKLTKFEKISKDFKKYVEFFKSYPDYFIDMITPKDSKFRLFFYQRVFLRSAMRHKYFFATFTRAFSKSFLSMLVLLLKCVFYPGIKLFIVSGTKEQSANIAKEKIEEIFELFPALAREVKHSTFQKDYVKLLFHNGSKLDVVAVRESSRGGRRNAGLVEEVILVDGKLLNEVIIPMMNVNRRSKNGEVDPNEPHKQQIYVTTAGYKGTFAYNKLKQFLVWSALKDDAFIMGGSWRIPVLHNLLDENFIEELKEDGTFNPLSFDREYESKWVGTGEDSFFNEDMISKNRNIKKCETSPVKNCEYVISVDVARSEGSQNANTIATVGKKIPKSNGAYMVKVVNMKVFHGEHFEEQSIKIKKLAFHYNAEMVCIDANGLGAGLLDYMIKENIDENTGEIFVPFSVTNDDRFDKYKTDDSVPLLYAIMSQGIASDIHVNCFSQISSGKVKFLVDEMEARATLLNTKVGQKMSGVEMAEYLEPYVNTTFLKDEMLNLRAKKSTSDGNVKVQLERINKGIQKDRFSSLEYLLWYIKQLEDKNRLNRKSNSNLMDYFFVN